MKPIGVDLASPAQAYVIPLGKLTWPGHDRFKVKVEKQKVAKSGTKETLSEAEGSVFDIQTVLVDKLGKYTLVLD